MVWGKARCFLLPLQQSGCSSCRAILVWGASGSYSSLATANQGKNTYVLVTNGRWAPKGALRASACCLQSDCDGIQSSLVIKSSSYLIGVLDTLRLLPACCSSTAEKLHKQNETGHWVAAMAALSKFFSLPYSVDVLLLLCLGKEMWFIKPFILRHLSWVGQAPDVWHAGCPSESIAVVSAVCLCSDQILRLLNVPRKISLTN